MIDRAQFARRLLANLSEVELERLLPENMHPGSAPFGRRRFLGVVAGTVAGTLASGLTLGQSLRLPADSAPVVLDGAAGTGTTTTSATASYTATKAFGSTTTSGTTTITPPASGTVTVTLTHTRTGTSTLTASASCPPVPTTLTDRWSRTVSNTGRQTQNNTSATTGGTIPSTSGTVTVTRSMTFTVTVNTLLGLGAAPAVVLIDRRSIDRVPRGVSYVAIDLPGGLLTPQTRQPPCSLGFGV